MLNSEEFVPIVSAQKYKSKRNKDRKRNSKSHKKSKRRTSRRAPKSFVETMKNAHKNLGGAQLNLRNKGEEIVWYTVMVLILLAMITRNLKNKIPFLKTNPILNKIHNWYDQPIDTTKTRLGNSKNIIKCEDDDGPMMCTLKFLFEGLFSSNKKALHVLSFVLTLFFITELWVNLLRVLHDKDNLGHPKFCLLGLRCYL